MSAIEKFSRRLTLKLLTLTALFGFTGRRKASAAPDSIQTEPLETWANTNDRVFLGGNLWANPMEDWKVVDGWAECHDSGGERSVHSLTHQITNPQGSFKMTVQVGQVAAPAKDMGAGFRIGLKSELDEVKSNCFAKSGLDIGVMGDTLVIGPKKGKVSKPVDPSDYRLELTGEGAGNEKVNLHLKVLSADGEVLGELDHVAQERYVGGNVAVLSQFKGQRRGDGAAYKFRDWQAGGDAFSVKPEQHFGPILWSMYSLSDSRGDEGFVMKISALTGPMGAKDSPNVELQVEKGGKWASLGEATLDTDAWVATFRIANWDEKTETPYKLIYREKHVDGSETPYEWAGKIKPNPEGRPLRLGALTCQNDYGFPYAPVADNLVKLDPDILYFSGDQIYESHGGFGVIREPAAPAILNYLRKYYQFGWAFREAMRNSPTLCIPDDHDVFQGNIWGEGGKPMDTDGGTSSRGGYIQPARMVNAVHRTCVGHHPDPYDDKSVQQDISVYYGEVVYGGVGFAVLGDRQWKTGPEWVDTGEGRADHVSDPDFDTSVLDKPGLVLLGERQEAFLEYWANDWRGHSMKVLLSQTVFGGMATHHGKYDGYLKADLDSGGWPQTARDRAIDILRPAMALHVNGDQHLTTLTQYGVKEQRDSGWSFCTPAISAGYPRWWRPDELPNMPHENRPKHGIDHTGEYKDGLGNKVYVYAVGNPEVGTEKNRYDKAHQKGSGFGLVTIDTEKKTYTLDSFRFLIDATDGKPENQFPGWPVTIHQKENKGENLLG